jgi:hypothetical protein
MCLFLKPLHQSSAKGMNRKLVLIFKEIMKRGCHFKFPLINKDLGMSGRRGSFEN